MKTDIEKNKLLGKVKQVKQDCFEANENLGVITTGSKVDDYHRQSYLQLYNEQGNLMQVKRGEGGTNVFYLYDKDGKLIEENIYNLSDTFLMKHIYRYDEKGNKIEFTKLLANGKVFNNFYFKYDENGNMTEGYTDKNVDAGILSVFKYDENGKLLESYNDKGELVSKYDIDGNEIEHYEYFKDATYNSKSIKTYNEKGGMTERRTYNYLGEHLGRTTRNNYDTKGNLIESGEYNQDGSLDTNISYKYKYDEKDNWIEQVEFRNYKYGYNAEGKWEKTEFKTGIPAYIIRREIEYFN